MRVLLTGASGLLGRAFITHTPPGWQVRALTRSELNITDGDAFSQALEDHPTDWVINCAAYTAVDAAEADPEAAHRANVDGPAVLARVCADRRIPIVHISTDFVFDGRSDRPYIETDPTGPLSVYGQTKLLGELAISDAHADHLIVRTAWLYGDTGASFPATILRLARDRGAVRVVDDQVGSPTYAPHLVQGICAAMEGEIRGTLHLAGQGAVSRFGFARALLDAAEVSADLQPATTADFPAPAERPAYSVLGSLHPCGISLEHWTAGVEAFVAQEVISSK